MLSIAPFLLLFQSGLIEHGLVWLRALGALLVGARLLVRQNHKTLVRLPRFKARRPRLIGMQRIKTQRRALRPVGLVPKRSLNAKTAVPAGRICIRDQWQRAAGVVETALQSADEVNRCQMRARQQLDAAEHAINTLLDDIAGIMPLPIERTRPGQVVSMSRQSEISAQPLAA